MIAIKREDGSQHFCIAETGYQNAKHILRLRMDDGSVHIFSSVQLLMRKWKLVADDEDLAGMPTLKNRDERLEALWKQFADVPMNPDTECMEEDFLHFPAGTDREEIWHWFDERHSKGVAYLLYGK